VTGVPVAYAVYGAALHFGIDLDAAPIQHDEITRWERQGTQTTDTAPQPRTGSV
jgi:hypothetical protein